jgi:type I restriction enzyme M protein
VDSIGRAFEEFFGSVFRGELGQYFTMRQLSRFTVAVLDISPTDYVLDPTAGSGGFLLEVLLQEKILRAGKNLGKKAATELIIL